MTTPLIENPCKSSIDFVVTGTPRSGTTFVAKVLQKFGVECRHERRFTPWDFVLEAYRLDRVLWGDSSWLAAPFLQVLPGKTRVFHVVRDPLKTINSIIGTGQIDWPDSGYRAFIAKYCFGDENYWPTDVAREAQDFWVRWNSMVSASDRVTLRFRVEDIASTLPKIADSLGLQFDLEKAASILESVRTNMNTRKHRSTLRLEKDDLIPEVIKMARLYGYDY